MIAGLVARIGLPVAIAAALGLGAFAGLQTLRLADAKTDLALEQKDRADERRNAEAAARLASETYRAQEQAWREKQQENARVQFREIELAAAGRTAAESSAGRLLKRIAALESARRQAAADAAAQPAGPTADPAAGMFADVLGRCIARVRILGSYADAARIAGQRCEGDYGALTASSASGNAP